MDSLSSPGKARNRGIPLFQKCSRFKYTHFIRPWQEGSNQPFYAPDHDRHFYRSCLIALPYLLEYRFPLSRYLSADPEFHGNFLASWLIYAQVLRFDELLFQSLWPLERLIRYNQFSQMLQLKSPHRFTLMIPT